MHQIDKQFDFCYGHRVWSQKLDANFSLDNVCACRRLHGHQGTIKIGLSAHSLTNGMVTDFKHLNFFKKILDDHFDHKFIIDQNDPQFERIISLNLDDYLINEKFYKRIDEKKLHEIKILGESDREYFESFVIVDFIPTSENLSKMFFEIVESKVQKLGVKVEFVDFWETPKSHCRYTKS